MNARQWAMQTLAAALLALAQGAAAQPFPSKPISLVVGTPPAGAVDAYARVVAERMEKALGRQIIVENKPGANGNISAEAVARSAADGHTLWVGTQSMTEINPSAFDRLRWSLADFVPLIKGVEAPLVLVVHKDVPVRAFDGLQTWVKANPGKVAYASFSPGTPSHFLGFRLSERLGLDMLHVPFKGSGPQVQNLVGGHVPLGFTQVQTALPHLKSGALVALATTGATRWRDLPEVPTIAELGHPDLGATIWFGLFARAGTAPAVIATLSDAAKQAHADADTRTRLERMGFDVPGTSGPQFAAAIREGTERWAKLVKATGFKASN